MRSARAPAALAILLAGCGGGDDPSDTLVQSETLTIYSSVPAHGASAAAGKAAFAGQRRALEEAGGRAGGKRVRLVRLPATRPGDVRWDPGTVKANAEMARADPSTIAYLGELDYGGSAISLPVTNRADLLQVSPTDSLTSLTRSPAGRPRAGPERYYPEGRRTFVRLVPSDQVQADAMVTLLRARGVRSVAILHGEGIADRELAAVVRHRLRVRGREPELVGPVREGEEVPASVLERIARSRPGAIVVVGAGTPAIRATLAALSRRVPAVPVLASSGLAAPGAVGDAAPREIAALTPVLPARAQPPQGRRLMRSIRREGGGPVGPEALYGYESMALALAAIDRAGPDRRVVVRAALAARARRTVLGRLSFAVGADVRPGRLALIDISGGGRTLERVLP